MKILGIETSCDETAVALVEARGGIKNPSFTLLENLVSSQIDIHKEFGGVVPNLAKREHIKKLPILVKKIAKAATKYHAYRQAGETVRKYEKNQKNKSPFFIPGLDLIAVTSGPGLEPALWAGITFAEELGKQLNVPVVGAHHLEGHLYTFLLEQKSVNPNDNPPAGGPTPKQNGSGLESVSSNGKAQISSISSKIKNQKSKLLNKKIGSIFPAIGLIISGGHTMLVKMDSLTKFVKLGETRDDAVGEAFDKVARLLDLPYPGGPQIEKLAREGDPRAIPFPRPMMREKNYDFSFSGLKTAVLYHLRDNLPLTTNNLQQKADVAASFQEAAFDVLITKTLRAAKEYKARSLLLAGGVAANQTLFQRFSERIRADADLRGKGNAEKRRIQSKSELQLIVPPPKICTDNGVMMALAGYMNYLYKKRWPLTAEGGRTL